MAYVHDGLFIILPPYTGSSLPSGDNGGQEASTPLPTSGNGGKGEELVLWGKLLYRIAGNFRGGANFRYFRDYPVSHEIFHPRNFPPTNFQSVIAYRASEVTKFKTTKINSEDPRQLFTKI